MTSGSDLEPRQPWLLEVPACELKRQRSKWDEAKEMQLIQQTEGLVTPAHAAALLDVSRQLVYRFAAEGRFERFEFFGQQYLSLKAVREFHDLERPPGRHLSKAA